MFLNNIIMILIFLFEDFVKCWVNIEVLVCLGNFICVNMREN